MNAGTFGKATLYAIPLFLAPCIEKLADYLINGIWPNPPVLVFCLMLGLSSMCIGLRAYFDGSAERAKQENAPEPVTGTNNTEKAP